MSKNKIYTVVILCLFFAAIFFFSALLSSRAVLKGDIVTVPDLKGKILSEARVELGRINLLLSPQTTSRSDDRYEKGKIIEQTPAPKDRIKVGKSIKVVISEGSEMVEVPMLTGKSMEASIQLLADTGLFRGKISQIHSPRYPAGRVIAQDPPLAFKVKKQTPVNILVSQGERDRSYIMPDLIGLKAESAIDKLKSLELKVERVIHAYYPGTEPGIILKQSPVLGYRIQKRSLINLEVSK